MHALVISHPNLQQKLALIIGVLLLLCAFCYGYGLKRTVSNVVERKGAQEAVALLASEVATLESRYIALKSGITLAEAARRGMVEPERVHYAVRNDSTPVLTLEVRND